MKNNFTLKLTFLLLLAVITTNATIRYVSHTGSSTPPYTTWETAADSIQKCIDYSVDGDTIIVANGVYNESLIVNKYLWLWGSSMDSTIINGFGLYYKTIEALSDFSVSDFKIIGPGTSFTKYAIYNADYNVNVKNCRVETADICLNNGNTSGRIENVIISNCRTGIFIACDTCQPVITNSIIIMGGINSDEAIDIFDGGNPTITNNVLIGNFNSLDGVGITFLAKTIRIENNIVAGFESDNIEGDLTDTAIIHNNISSYSSQRGITIDSKTDMRNNIISNNEVGVSGPTGTNSDYNLYWENDTHTTGGLAQHDIVADPMFVNDTIPNYGGSYDFHLQMFSPAIDKGDPNILDVDGSRSDIGAYGGPGGSSYMYLNLPPRAPVNLNADVEGSTVTLTWNKNSEADTSHYNVYKDTVANFTIDSTKLIGSTTDTIFVEPIPKGTLRLYYKVTCVDTKGNESEPSEEAVIILTVGTDEWKAINNYTLYQNYPNPFNPSTKIGYKLISRGYVKLLVYDITGALVTVLVNQVQEAGYYEVEFNSSGIGHQASDIPNLASGIYLYRIEVIGEGNIPRFSDMKKMILIK